MMNGDDYNFIIWARPSCMSMLMWKKACGCGPVTPIMSERSGPQVKEAQTLTSHKSKMANNKVLHTNLAKES